ncbi:HAUS augmin-like complex subunit 4 [Menidia menidia]
MSFGSEITNTLLLGKDEILHQRVLASFPLCDVTEEDLTQNPLFCKLLASLTQYVDKTGLTVPVKTELDKAEQKLHSQKHQWLCSESLQRGLQEMIQDNCVRKHHTTVPPDQNMFFETMEKCLLLAHYVKQLDSSSTANWGQPAVLGLTPQNLMELTPIKLNVDRMKQGLSRKLEKHLKDKCLTLLSYLHPEWENDSEGLKVIKLPHSSSLLDKEKKKAESLKETWWENLIILQRQTQLYLSELTKCIQVLQTLILDHRIKMQTDLDQRKLDYLKEKCELVLQKIKTEMLEIQLETYTTDTISAHQKIREKLESELKALTAEKQAVESKLSSFEILGKDFEGLANEYFRLRQEIEMKNWALKELTQYKNK